MQPDVTIGLVFSTTGSYRTVSREMLSGALLAVSEINADDRRGVRLATEVRDPGGTPEGYWNACEELLKKQGIRHVVGCYTSSSRKEVIPLFEKFDALLWYPSHYEGFESADNVVYTGAAPNQHIIPLTGYALSHFGRTAYCCGSNYIWAWENNRIMREVVATHGGRICAERYLPVGNTEIEPLLDEIAALRPDFVFNTLIGETAYAFYRAYHRRGLEDPRFRPDATPVTSCSLSEPELVSIGGAAAAGHICSSVYFSSVATETNRSFRRRFRMHTGGSIASADAEASYNAVHLFADAVARARTADPQKVLSAAYESRLAAPQGEVRVDRSNNHCYLTPRLARSRRNGTFAILASSREPVQPDPYLTRFDAEALVPEPAPAAAGAKGEAARPKLRIVKR